MRILVVDDERAAAEELASFLRLRDHEATVAFDGQAACEQIEQGCFDLVLSDIRMPRMDGLELTRWITAERPETIVVMITAYTSISGAIDALRQGAFDYLTKPVNPDELACLVERIAEVVELRRELELLRGQVKGPDRLGGLVGRDPAMFEVYRCIRTAARSHLPVLVSGETGTGKSLAARAIHELSGRSGGPLVEVNCGGIPPTLIESELFGHIRGAFTGAHRSRTGRFRTAHGGTLVLDEIGCLDEASQAKLLQVIERPRVVPVGADAGVEVDVRLVAATNDDLAGRVEAGTFRRDLYYRLNVVRIHMPPLRQRRGDIPLLVRSLLETIAPKRRLTVSPALMQLLMLQRWPGNIRELRNVLEVMLASLEGDELEACHAPPWLEIAGEEGAEPRSLEDAMSSYERFVISEELRRTDGNLSRCAGNLGVSPRTLERKLAKHGLQRRDFRSAAG